MHRALGNWMGSEFAFANKQGPARAAHPLEANSLIIFSSRSSDVKLKSHHIGKHNLLHSESREGKGCRSCRWH
jgi:hypothetical protein